MAKASYKDSGVDLDKYRESMGRLPALMHRTFGPRVIRQDGGFAGLYQLDFSSRLFARDYKHPVLVACTDGVGTKLKVAQRVDRHNTIGQDLVAMCVNDALCCGAEPLFFLDYVAMSHDDPQRLEQIVSGIGDACILADCALLGGETAIMPDLYQHGDYDLAGFCIGVVERHSLIDGSAIAEGDLVIGVGSSGLHSNGYSLARKIVFEMAGLEMDAFVEPLAATVGDAMLEPTLIYSKPIRQALCHYKVKNVIHGIAHITGGGICENIQRILPNQLDVALKRAAWDVPPIFDWLQSLGDVAHDEMFRVFNMGIGMALIVSPYYAQPIMRILSEHNLRAWPIGRVIKGTGIVALSSGASD
jgi:phosphoribosylformylglycinamidine cyclo-ligase